MRRITMLFTVAAMMAVLLSISAGPASARVIFHGDNDNDGRKSDRNNNGSFIVSNGNDWWDDDDDDFDFFGNHGFDFDRDGEVSLGLGDVENESGDIELENDFSIGGNNNNACFGQQQFANSGNFTNQQGALQFDSDADDLEFGGGEFGFGPENETACEQDVEQASAASSWGWW
jgi:hypothetical protein